VSSSRPYPFQRIKYWTLSNRLSMVVFHDEVENPRPYGLHIQFLHQPELVVVYLL
ncbi:Hypothetical predicted protein, partial [Pelobates cultripes]